jgi:DNA adenine methylase
MKYMGSKRRIAKDILPIILQNRKADQFYVEPFVGGANLIDKVTGPRIGADINDYLIEALKIIRDCPETLPDLVTEEDHAFAKKYLEDGFYYSKGEIGYIAFNFSFGADWKGGYRRDKKGQKGSIDNMLKQSKTSKNSALKQSPFLKGIDFIHSPYNDLEIPPNSILYCDPPYENTTKYKHDFEHEAFWQWCRDKENEGHEVFISEYSAPDDFICVWEKHIPSTLNGKSVKTATEKLFIPSL